MILEQFGCPYIVREKNQKDAVGATWINYKSLESQRRPKYIIHKLETSKCKNYQFSPQRHQQIQCNHNQNLNSIPCWT